MIWGNFSNVGNGRVDGGNKAENVPAILIILNPHYSDYLIPDI